MAENTKRDVLPDVLKALLILSVLLQHSATAVKAGLSIGAGNWTNWLSANPFNMPLFMAICGYYFFHSAQRRSFGNLLKSRLLTILVPCLAWIALLKCACRFLFEIPVDWLPWPYDLWFLWSVLICTLLGCICHYAFRRVEGWVMAALCGLLCLLPCPLWHVAYMFPFFAVGYMVNKYNLPAKARPWMGWAALAAYVGLHGFISSGSSVWVSHSYLFGGAGVFTHICINGYRFAIGLAGSAAFIFVVSRLYYACCAATPPPPPYGSVPTNQEICNGAGAVLSGDIRIPSAGSGAVHGPACEKPGSSRPVRSASHPVPGFAMGVHTVYCVHDIPSLPGSPAPGANQPRYPIPYYRQGVGWVFRHAAP